MGTKNFNKKNSIDNRKIKSPEKRKFLRNLFLGATGVGAIAFLSKLTNVLAFGTSTPSSFGHSAKEIDLSQGVEGDALFNGNVNIGGNLSFVNGINSGYTANAFNAGTKSSGTYTPEPSDGNIQKYVNGGAHTLAAPIAAGDYTLVIQCTNNASAGNVTTTGFTKVDGDSITTANAHKFLIYITKINSLIYLHVKALQ